MSRPLRIRGGGVLRTHRGNPSRTGVEPRDPRCDRRRQCCCRETGEDKTILFGLTGTGYFDMTAYEKYNDGQMGDYIPTDDELAEFRKNLKY